MKFLHSIAVQNHSVGSDSIEVFDLAVNPLSVVLLTMRPLNSTGTPGNFADYLSMCSAFNWITIADRGQTVFKMTGADAAVLAYHRHGILYPMPEADDTDNWMRSVTLPILMGRFAYDPETCYPARRRGELTIELDIDVLDTGYDNFAYQIDTIELLDAKPKYFERKTTQSVTLPATGFNDIDLPVGNVVRGLLAYGTTAFGGGASPTPTLGRMELLLDNQQEAFAAIDFETAVGLSSLMGRQPPVYDGHKHRVDATGGTTQNTTKMFDESTGLWQNYCYLDLDPWRDDSMSINTAGASRFHLRTNAEAANAVRIVTVERVSANS